MQYSIGIDIGGTTIAGGIINHNGDLIQQEVVQSAPEDSEQMFEQVIRCVDKLMAHSSIPFSDIQGIGAGVPGKVDRENGVAMFQNNLPWDHFLFADRLKERLSIDRVVIDNDVHVAAFAEWKTADVGPNDLLVYMTISTGISSAIMNGGTFIRGSGFPGEMGLVPVIAPRETDGTQRLEQAASGPALQTYAAKMWQNDDVTAEQVFRDYYAGDPSAETLINDVALSLSHGVYMIASMLDPHQIVFGGSVATQNPALLKLISQHLENYLIPEQTHILDNLKVSGLGYDRSIIGAGLMALQS